MIDFGSILHKDVWNLKIKFCENQMTVTVSEMCKGIWDEVTYMFY